MLLAVTPASYLRVFSAKILLLPNHGSFLPQKFPAIRYTRMHYGVPFSFLSPFHSLVTLSLNYSSLPHLPLFTPHLLSLLPHPLPHTLTIDHSRPASSGIRELLRAQPGRGAQETPPPLSTTLTTQTKREVIITTNLYSALFLYLSSPLFSPENGSYI